MNENIVLPECLENILKSSEKYDIKVNIINDTTLSLRSKTVLLDEWLIIYDPVDDEIVMKHMNKSRKVTHHTQARFPSYNWIWAIQKLLKHDEYIIDYRGNFYDSMITAFNLI